MSSPCCHACARVVARARRACAASGLSSTILADVAHVRLKRARGSEVCSLLCVHCTPASVLTRARARAPPSSGKPLQSCVGKFTSLAGTCSDFLQLHVRVNVRVRARACARLCTRLNGRGVNTVPFLRANEWTARLLGGLVCCRPLEAHAEWLEVGGIPTVSGTCMHAQINAGHARFTCMFPTEGGLRAVHLVSLQPRATLAMRYAADLLGRLVFPQSTITPTTLTSRLNSS
jgi:hypothetical protein